ncbi:MAG: tetratricopeptide repeat protein [Nocardiopsaceae bacterium]|jgi:tetratricopeptide (TPR) repeat protein|nr:tetratricopeptide repeat protein [Nocardiopsaceae bacterium]
MTVDARGLSMTGSAEATERYDQAIDHLIRFHPDVVQAGSAAVAADPNSVMAKVFCAYLALMATEEAAVSDARDALGGLRADDVSREMLPRERAHVAAAERWISGDMTGAGNMLGEISVEYPRDLLALSVGHQIDFFTGDAVTLRDRIGRALDGWRSDDSQRGFVQGMYAFGLEESNLYQQSEEVGQAAVESNPDDVWGIHAVVHTYEMAGRIPDGVTFMRSREADWLSGNFLNVHNSWHYALYLLQGGDSDGALAMYDRMIRHAGSEDAALELVDASALLWRMHLEGTPVSDRWRPLTTGWANILKPGFYPFNDMHAVMSFIGNGELERAEDLVSELEEVASRPDSGSTGWAMTKLIGLPVCRSMVQFGRGEYESVIADLLPIRTRVHTFGGSHAQRDAVERTLLEAAIRAGRLDLAAALVSERLSVRECNTYAWSKMAWLRDMADDKDGAAAARAREGELAGQIRTAAG